MELVRTKSGAADAEDFASSKGSPIVLDEATGKGYVIKVDGSVIELGSGTFQPLDADLTAIAALGFASTSFLKKTAADTWALDTTTYAPLASPTFTGTPAAPTAAATDDSTQLATTAHVKDYAPFGTWTPTLTNTTNVGASTAYLSSYIAVGSAVICMAKVNVDTTSATTDTVLGISLPIASDFANDFELNGVAAMLVPTNLTSAGRIFADTTNNRATLTFNAVGAANYTWSLIFMYRVI